MSKKVAFKTLGCRLNQFETNALASQFKKAEYEIVDFSEDADAYIINTCTVTNQGDQKSRNTINQALSRTHQPVTVVTGCMANSKEKMLSTKDQLTYLVKNEEKSSIFSLVDAHFKGEIDPASVEQRDVFAYPETDKIFKTRGMIKIQDGCDNHCTFCIIPFVRGNAVSRPLDAIVKNVENLRDNGYKEIVITGVNIGRYLHDGNTFEDVVEAVLNVPGDFRVRISSMEPEGLGDKFFELLSHPKMTPHLHMCLQSGSDQVLINMRRMYDSTKFLKLVARIRKINPLFNFTTDVMVGFPGESERNFQETCDVIDKVGFSHIHTFKYSEREHTRAARMKDQVPENLKQERSVLVRGLSDKNKKNYRSQFVGMTQKVIVEKKPNSKFSFGYGEYYVPVEIQGEKIHEDTLVKVRITGVNPENDFALIGEVV